MCGGPKLRLRGAYALNIYLPDIGPPDVNFLYVAAPPPRLPSAWVVELGGGRVKCQSNLRNLLTIINP